MLGAGPFAGRPFWSRGRACTFLAVLFVVVGAPAAFFMRIAPGQPGYHQAAIDDILLCGDLVDEYCQRGGARDRRE
jgi:hypothetical protein